MENHRTDGIGAPLFGKPLPLAISGPPVGLKPLSKTPSPASSFGVTKEWSGLASADASWNVRGENLEVVPADYPLERTHREILDTDASVVACRISDALASMSIETEFDCKNAKAKCKTGDYVGFRIRLYAGNESGQPVVVEVQRRCGSVSSFMSTCRAILSAAEGKPSQPSVAARRGPPMPVRELKCLASEFEKERNVEKEADAALSSVVRMMRSSQLDTNLLGIENLASLTDPIKTSPAVALAVSKSIALGEEKYDVREEIRLLTERDVFASDADDMGKGISPPAEQLRHFALIVFANAMTVCAKDGSLEVAVKSQTWFSEQLVPSLLGELRRAPSNAINAYQAAICLSSLLSCSDCARRLFLENSVSEVLEQAHSFGKSRHTLLAREAELCLKLLDLASS
jgi:hypothetical protein